MTENNLFIRAAFNLLLNWFLKKFIASKPRHNHVFCQFLISDSFIVPANYKTFPLWKILSNVDLLRSIEVRLFMSDWGWDSQLWRRKNQNICIFESFIWFWKLVRWVTLVRFSIENLIFWFFWKNEKFHFADRKYDK